MAGKAKVFDQILRDAWENKGIGKRQTVEASKWFRRKAKELGQSVKPPALMSEEWRMRSRVAYGSMYFFFYNPKWRKELPYYDTFPLIFPVESAKGGFYGINMHYLDYKNRAFLMDALFDIRSDNNFNVKTKLILSYQVLKHSSSLKAFKPCFKHYLNAQVQSRFMKLHPIEWNIALMLPVERFQKKTKRQVWIASRKKIGKKG
jgi:hypothetical protein